MVSKYMATTLCVLCMLLGYLLGFYTSSVLTNSRINKITAPPKVIETKCDHVRAKDIIEADRICKNHEGVSAISMYSDGLTIYCKDFFNISDYVYTPKKLNKELNNEQHSK